MEKIESRNIFYGFLFIFLFGLTFLNFFVVDTFQQASVVYSLVVIASVVCVFCYEKTIINPFNLILLCFVLFQFGLPFLVAFVPNYDNWYLTQFSERILIQSTYYSALCINGFILGAWFAFLRKKGKESKKPLYFIKDSKSNYIHSIGLYLLVVSGIVALPLAFYVAYLASIYGYSYIKVDSMGIYNGVTNFAQEMFPNSLLLTYVFARNKQEKRFLFFLSILYSIVLVFTGARTVPLALILTFVLMVNQRRVKNKRQRLLKNTLLFISFILIIFLGVFVAQYRHSGSSEIQINKVIENAVSELGFNFTSICFTQTYIPSNQTYFYGSSYLISFLSIIPKSLDFTGLITSAQLTLPEYWLANTLHASYGSLYDFGVGFSVIAESFYNFGYFGFVIVGIQGYVISKLMRTNGRLNTGKFNTYVCYVLMFSLITYPRRSFNTLFKSIEYGILLIMLILWILYPLINNLRKVNKNEYKIYKEHK